MASTSDDLAWHKVLNADELPEGRVTTRTLPSMPSFAEVWDSACARSTSSTTRSVRRSRTKVSVWWKSTATLS